MSFEFVIKVENLSKCYQIYNQPRDRLKQFILPHVQRAIGRPPKKYFREFWALKNASFNVKKGETVGIIGRNGSGKSTLLQLICGTLSPTSGDIHTKGRIAALLELGAGFNTEFTGRENVMLSAAILGFPQDRIEERMTEVLAFSELGEFLDQPVKTYSSGMYARLAFSIAIYVDPDILIIDEALAVGDSRFVAKCMRRIKDIQERGTTILFVSHDVSSVRTLCQRAIWLHHGKIVKQGDVFPVTGQYMEFIFKDDEHEEERGEANNIVETQDKTIKGDSVISKKSVDLPDKKTAAGLDARPVIHWGSHKGIILSASVCDKHDKRKDLIKWGETIAVVVNVNVPSTISRKHLSVSFSIKDIKGTDLIVSTTHDFGASKLPNQEHFVVRFIFENFLVTGEFLLVATVENREYHDIHYYEYLEGTHYFSSVSEQRLFGIFHPHIKQIIKTN